MRKTLSKAVIRRAAHLGFTPPQVVALSEFGQAAGKGLKEYIANGHHGTMTWMEETQGRRSHPQNLWPDARSAIVLGLNYGPEFDPLPDLEHTSKGVVSVYAKGRDYHGLIKGRLKELAGLIARDTDADVKVFVDTAPLMEKPLAQAAGLGWQGKHTNLVSRNFGSWLFLGVILSAAEITPDVPEIDACGSCRACLDICPTQAFSEAYRIDARRCISYLTIEHKGAVDLELREKMGNRIYGCDDCLAICPWNKFASVSKEAKLKAPDSKLPDLEVLSTLSDTEFRKHYANSPIKRIGLNRFLRNVLYAIGNSQDSSLLTAARKHLGSSDLVVRDAADWAIAKLSNSQREDI